MNVVSVYRWPGVRQTQVIMECVHVFTEIDDIL